MAERLGRALDYVERIEHLTVIAESRRNASLREIDRRRPLLAETLRHTVQQIESDELEVIETTPAKGENAAGRVSSRSRLTAKIRARALARERDTAALAQRVTLFGTG